MGELWGRDQFFLKTWAAAVLEEFFSDCLFSQNENQLLMYSQKRHQELAPETLWKKLFVIVIIIGIYDILQKNFASNIEYVDNTQ